KMSAANYRNVESVKIIGCHGAAHARFVSPRGDLRLAFDLQTGKPKSTLPPSRWNGIRYSHCASSGQPPVSRLETKVEMHDLLIRVIAPPGQCYFHGQHATGLHPEILLLDVCETAQQQPRAAEENNADCDLRGHQTAPQKGMAAQRGLLRVQRLQPRPLQRCGEPEDHSARATEQRRKHRDAQVEMGFADKRDSGWRQIDEELQQTTGSKEACQTSRAREQQRLRERLADQPASARSDGHE